MIGINRTSASLIETVPDLATRAVSISLGREADSKIVDLVSKGERALNLRFTHAADFALASNGSYVVAQMLCEHAILQSDVQERQNNIVSLDVSPTAVIRRVVDQLRSQFHKGLQSFGLLDSDHGVTRGAPIALLWHLSRDPAGAVSIADVRPQLGRLEASLDVVLSRVEALRESEPAPLWRNFLDCDPASGQLALDDPKLGFYLKHFDWVRFGQLCGVKLKRTADGELQFLDTVVARSSRQTKPEPRHELRGVTHVRSALC